MNQYESSIHDYTDLLLEQQSYIYSNQPITDIILHNTSINKKTQISAWNDQYNQNPQSIIIPNSFNHQNLQIHDFLSTINIKNKQFNKSKFYSNRKKNYHIDNDEQKSQIPLNNTIITFPKSRSQSRKLQNDQKIILQKLYRRRQKSKIIPRQIFINGAMGHSSIRSVYPTKNYLCKNRSFIEQNSLRKASNPENKSIKEVQYLRKRFSNSYYKKNDFFEIGIKNQRGLILKNKKLQTLSSVSKKETQKIERQNFNINKPYMTFYKIQKPQQNQYDLDSEQSIQKIKQNAKITHLNRIKDDQSSQIQLLGSTITKWKNEVKEKLKSVTLIRSKI